MSSTNTSGSSLPSTNDAASQATASNDRSNWLPTLFTLGATIIAIALAAFFIVLPMQRQNHAASEWVEHTHLVIETVDTIMASTTDAETGQRGFLLTEDNSFLKPYIESLKNISLQFSRLHDATAYNAVQQNRVTVMQQQIDAKLAELSRTIALTRGGDVKTALDVVRGGEGRRLMDAIRESAADITSEEHHLLQNRYADLKSAQNTANTTALVLTILVGIGIALACGTNILLINAVNARKRTETTALVQRLRLAKEAGDKLRESEARYALAWTGTGVGMWDCDITTKSVSVSHRFKHLLGFAADDVPDYITEWSGRLHPDDSDATLAMLKAHLNRQSAFDVECRLMTKSGEWRWFHASGQAAWDENGQPCRMAGSLADITETKQQQQALRTSEQTVRSAMEATGIGMALVAVTGQWLMVNPALCELLGYTADELLQRDFQSSIDAEELEQILETVRQMLTGERARERIDLRCVHRNGRTFWVDWNASLVRDDAGEPKYFVWQLQDVTERRQMATMKDEFVSTVNHELRTPLSTIYAAISLLRARNTDQLNAQGAHLLELANQGCTRLNALVNDILDLDKIAAGKMNYVLQTLPLGALVQDIVNRHIALAEQHEVSFVTQLLVDDVDVYIDPSRFNQALVNLLSNAAKYSPKKDTVTIHLALEAAGQVRVSVSDNGPGIPESFRDKVFGRFARADATATRKVGGSGLGLNITKRIIEELGGTITFDTAPGKGTTFHFHLPIQTVEAKAA